MPRMRKKEPGQSQKEYKKRMQKQIPLSYKVDVAAKIYTHAADNDVPPVTWIKQAIAEKYKRETGEDLQ